MKTTAVTNLKGGTGKTTTAVNLAAAIACSIPAKRKGAGGFKKDSLSLSQLPGRTGRVLIIDLDGQQNTAESLGIASEDQGLFQLFSGEPVSLASLVEETGVPGLDIIRGSDSLYKVEKVTAGEPGADQLFARAFALLPSRWDHVVIDLPPARGVLTFSGLSVAQTAIVVVSAQYLPLKQTTKVLEMVEKVRANLNPNLREIRYLINMLDARTRSSVEVAETLRKHLGEAVYDTAIRANCRISEAPSHGMPVVQYDPRSNGALDFIALAKEYTLNSRPRVRATGEGAHVTA